ncbi:hypothetical protein ACQ4PT_059839 [Festuca glaucescens]
MHNTNKEQHGGTDDVAVARPVENTKECATSLAVIENKKGSQVHKSLSTDNRDKPPSSSAIASPQKRGHKKKANNKDKHSTDSAIVPTKGRKVDTALEETNKGRSKRLLASKDSEKEALPAKRRKMGESNKMLPSKGSEAASDKDHLMCQMSIQTIIDAAEQLKNIPELINSVRDAGFGHFIDTKIKGSINLKGMSFILKHIDIPTMTVSFSEEKKIEINRYAIHHLYGIPNGHLSAPRPNENNEVLPELKQELGFRSDEDITARKLVDMLIVMVNEHVESKNVINRDLALKLFYLILFNKGLCIGTAPRISSKEASMVKGLDYDKIRDMDFCQLMVDELQTSAIKWQDHEVLKYKYIEGLAVAPLIMYLDSLICKDLTLMGKDTPRVLFLDEKKLIAISKADRNMAAQKGNEDWVFGKIINWKAKNDRVYKTISEEREEEIMVQKCKSIFFAVAGGSFHGENARPKNIPARTASEHQGALLIKDSNAVQSDTINSIKNLMQEVLNLTSNLQTSSQLLGRGIPEDIEDRKIDNLRLQTSSLLSMFDLFGVEHKSLLNRYCIDAKSSEINQVTSIPAANDEHMSCVAKEAHQTVELDIGKDAEISNVIAEADGPDLGKSAATITETSAHKLAESLDPKDQDKTCTSPTKTEEVQNPTDYMQGGIQWQRHGQRRRCDIVTAQTRWFSAVSGVHEAVHDSQHEMESSMVAVESCCASSNNERHSQTLETNQTGPSELMFEETGDAKPKKMAIKDGSTIMEDPCAISVQNANDALIKGTEEENELAPTGDNAADEQEETNVVSWQKQQINKETSGMQSEEEKNSNIAIEEEAIADIKIPCFEEGDKDNPVGHYFMMAVNLKKRRFELLDSLGGEGAEQHFVNTAEVFKEIWKEAYKQSKGRLSPENLDDFTYEKPRVIPLQGATLNCGVYMIMFLMFWTGKSLLHIRQDDILYIRKRLLYLILMWEPLKINIGLIESLHRDDFIKINSGDYSIIRKQTTVRPNMNVIVSLPDVNIPNLKEIDDGKENYPQEQEYVLISSQEDYIMQCLKGRVGGEDDLKKHLDGSFQPEETTKNGEEDKSQQQEKPVVIRNNEDKSMEYLRAREAKFDDPSRNLKEEGPHMIQTNAGQKRLNIVLFTPGNKKSSPPGYKVKKDMYSSLTGSQGFQTPPKDLKSNTVDVQHIDNLTKRKRKVVSSSDVTSTKRPNITARKICEPVAEYRPKKFQNQGKANILFNYLLKSNKFLDTKVFDAPAMHSDVPDMRIPLSGNEIKKQFGTSEFLDGATMDYIIDEMNTTSELYHTGERVLLSQGFIMMARMELVLKEVYGLDAYNASKQPTS